MTPVEEIVSFFKTYAPKLGVTKADLQQPQPERVQELYRWLLRGVTNCPDSVFTQVNFMDACFECPDLHDHSHALISLSVALNYVIYQLSPGKQLPTVRLSDLLKPTTPRTVKFMSMFVAFAKFIDERRAIVKNVFDKVGAAREQRDSLQTENDRLKEKINRLKASDAQNEVLCKQLQAENDHLQKNLQQHKRNKTVLDKESKAVEVELKTKENRDAELTRELAKLRNEEDRLQMQILQSPKKYAAEVENLGRRRGQCDAELHKLKEKSGSLASKRSRIPHVEALMRSLLASLEDVGKIKQSERFKQTELQQANDHLSTLRCRLKDAEFSANEKREEFAIKEGHKAKLRQQYAAQIADLRHETEERERHAVFEVAAERKQIHGRSIARLKSEHARNEHRSLVVQDECNEISGALAKEAEEHAECLNKLNLAYRDMLGQIDYLNNRTLKRFQEAADGCDAAFTELT